MTANDLEDLKSLKELGFDFNAEKISTGILIINIINIIIGLGLIVIGVVLLLKSKEDTNGKKKTIGWILIGIGIVMICAHLIQTVVF